MRLAEDWIIASGAWSCWEAANGYPTSFKRNKLRMQISGNFRAYANINLRISLFVSTTMALGRLTDHWSVSSSHKDRFSLMRLAEFLKHGSIANNIQSAHTEEFAKLRSRLEGGSTNRNLKSVKRSVKKFRDAHIAHTLDVVPSEFAVLEVRDCLVFCGTVIQEARKLLLNEIWNPKYYWRKQINSAQVFWNDYESSLDIDVLN
jgi:AbiU2